MDSDLVRIDKLQTAEQWSQWKFQVKVVLNASDLFEVVSDKNLLPVLYRLSGETDEVAKTRFEKAMKVWKKDDSRAQKVIATTVGQQPLLHIMNCNTSHEMWSKLLSIYEQKSETSVHILQQRFYAFSKDPDDSMAGHISKLEDLAQKLKELNEPVSDSMLITKILMTLPPEYGHFHSAWESTSCENRTIQKLTSRLMIEEARLNNESESSTNAMAAKRFSKKPGKCYRCKRFGHWKYACPEKGGESNNKSFDTSTKGEAFVSEVVYFSSRQNNDKWYMDSGASDHMCNRQDWFRNFKQVEPPIPVRIGNGKSIYACGKGDIYILSFDEKKWISKHLADVLYVPDIGLNLFSSGSALDKGLSMLSDSKKCTFFKDGVVVAVGVRNNRLFEMKFKVIAPVTDIHQANVASSQSIRIWHERMGHQNVAHLKKFLKSMETGYVAEQEDFFCEACAIGKQHRTPFVSSGERTSSKCEIIHVDLCGPMQVKSIGGALYFLLLKDDYSHFCTVYFVKQKSDVKLHIDEYIRSVKIQTGFDIKILRTDNGTEFVNQHFEKILKHHGIQHQKTIPYSPEQNGSAEREMRTIVESARTILHAKSLPIKLWAEAVNTSVYVLNLTGTSSIKGKTPYELWFGKVPKIDHLRIFGSVVYTHVPKERRQKWDKKSQKGVFVGYDQNVKGFRVWRQNTKVELCRDIIFRELDEKSEQKQDFKNDNSEISYNTEDSIFFVNHPNENEPKINNFGSDNDKNNTGLINENDNIGTICEINGNLNDTVDEINNNPNKTNENLIYVLDNTLFYGSPNGSASSNSDCAEQHAECDSSERSGDGSSLSDTSPNIVQQGNQSNFYFTDRNLRDRSQLPRPNYKERDSMDFDSTLMVAESLEPNSFEEALKCENSKEWVAAMDDEMKSLDENKTWTLADLPKDRKVVSNRWIYRLKHKTNGELERYKARLVVRGFTQEYGIDYEETFSPVVKFSSIRMILSVAAAEKLFLKQFDVKTAFLYGELADEIYMVQPKGYDDLSGKVCRLNKSLYGLKQASRCWNEKFVSFLKKFGFQVSKADPCVFISGSNSKRMILAIYIDDGLVAASCENEIILLLKYLNEHFQIKSGELQCFLGLQIQRIENGSIFVHQKAYAKKILSRFGMEEAVEVSIPVDPHHAMSPRCYPDEANNVANVPYRESIGSLMYLAVATRPDLSFALSVASQYLENPMQYHWTAVKRIMKYLRGSINKGIIFDCNLNNNLNCYSDADYAGDLDTRRSTSGFVIMSAGGAVSWCSQRQKTVALSTTEAEYIAATQTVKEIIWLNLLLVELTKSSPKTPNLYVDNQSAIKLIKNPEFHKRTKHIDVQYHFIREKFGEGVFELHYVPTNNQIADILTKALPREKFTRFLHMMGIGFF